MIYDDAKDYVHANWRTGRAGARGSDSVAVKNMPHLPALKLTLTFNTVLNMIPILELGNLHTCIRVLKGACKR